MMDNAQHNRDTSFGDEDVSLMGNEPMIQVMLYMGWDEDQYYSASADVVDTIRARIAAGVPPTGSVKLGV